MAHQFEKLKTLQVDRLMKVPGFHGDGRGLYLCVSSTAAASWIFRYMLNGRSRDMGLGSAHVLSLAGARIQAGAARKLKAEGIDPLDAKAAEIAEEHLQASRAMSFKEAAEKYIASHKAGWKNDKHKSQWSATLNTYAYPVIGAVSIAKVDITLVMKILDPIWSEKPETANRLRGRIETILDWAAARGFRSSENPARWRGHLDKVLLARGKVKKIVHHAALPYVEIAEFLQSVAAQPGIAPRAMRFTILTAARTGETIGARWSEINLVSKLWTIPAERMKGDREHRVPLSPAAIAVLNEQMKENDSEGFVFPGRIAHQALSNMAMLQLLRRMGRVNITTHGFRSSFRDWAAEQTGFPGEVAEAALAHVVGDKVEAAYRRGDLFDKRVRLMAAWGSFCTTPRPAGQVVQMRKPG
jgi:integrase